MFTSVYCSNDNIQVVVGKIKNEHIYIDKAQQIDFQEGTLINGVIIDEEAMQNTLLVEWKVMNLPIKNINLVIDSSSILTKLINIPRISSKNILAIIQSEFGDAKSDQDLLYDYKIINHMNDQGMMTILACAVGRSFIANYVNLFKSIGFTLSSIDIIPNTIIKFAKHFRYFTNETCILAAYDGYNITLTLFVNGEFRFLNRFRLLEEIGSEGSLGEILNRISVQVQFNKSQNNKNDVSEIYFIGDYEDAQELCDSVKSNLSISASHINLDNNFKINKNINSISNQFYGIINIIKEQKDINLLKRFKVNSERRAKTGTIFKQIAIIAILILLLSGTTFAINTSNKQAKIKLELLNSFIEDEQNQEVYQEYKDLIDKETKYNKLLVQVDGLATLLEAYPDLNIDLFNKIYTCTEGKIEFTNIQYDETDFTLVLSGVTQDVSSIPLFLGNLSEISIDNDYSGYSMSNNEYYFIVNCMIKTIDGGK